MLLAGFLLFATTGGGGPTSISVLIDGVELVEPIDVELVQPTIDVELVAPIDVELVDPIDVEIG